MTTHRERREEKRHAILKAAQEIFLTQGYIQTSMDKIARRAGVTKQTVYRYFPSKEILFESTLKSYGDRPGHNKFYDHLSNEDAREALLGFAVEFIRAHLADDHLAIIRLIVAENRKAPELTARFFSIGPSETEERLSQFFQEKLHMEETGHLVNMWISLLLSMRTGVLMGLEMPTEGQVKDYAEKTTDFFLKSLS